MLCGTPVLGSMKGVLTSPSDAMRDGEGGGGGASGRGVPLDVLVPLLGYKGGRS